MKEPVFILGCPRSGTTLLASLLRNSVYGEPVETHFITKYYRKLAHYGDLNDRKNLASLLKDILSERPVMQWKINLDVEKFYDELNEFNYREVVNKLCMKMAEKRGYKLWGDKTPHYTMDLNIIYKLFPESKYILIVRDGRDVALSLLNEPWGPNNILNCAEYWKRFDGHNDILDSLKRSNQLYFVRYEDLLENAEQIVPEIYAFLGEEYNKSEMDKLIGKIKKGNYNKWKKKMSQRQIKLFEHIAGNTLKRFGYETSYEETGVNGLVSGCYKLHESFMRAKFLFKINVIDGIRIKYFGKEPFAE